MKGHVTYGICPALALIERPQQRRLWEQTEKKAAFGGKAESAKEEGRPGCCGRSLPRAAAFPESCSRRRC